MERHMKRVIGVVGLVSALGLVSMAAAEPATDLDRRVVAASLFKNGLAVVTEEIVVPGPGRYRMEDPPIPLYGTWWITSPGEVETRAREEEVETPLPVVGGLADLQRALAGREVTLTLRGQDVPITGMVATPESPVEDRRRWDREYRREAHRYWFGSSPLFSVPAPEDDARSPFLVLERPDGTTTLIDRSTIVRVDVVGGLGSGIERVRRPILLLNVKSVPTSGAPIRISYLTKGIAWAPSYRLDLSDAGRITLAQQAVVRNELADMVGTELCLVTGFPNIPFGHVTSPLSPSTTWSNFFQQLDRRFDRGHAVTSNVATQQVVVMSGASGSGGALPDPDLGGGGLDLYEHELGRYDLAEGEALVVTTGEGDAPYERIVEWVVPDARRADGRRIERYQGFGEGDRAEDGPWDAVRFPNPLDYPMTTGVVTIFEDGRFQGQGLSPFTNPGSEITLRITRALSVTTRAAEQETAGERGLVDIGGRTFRRVEVSGDLAVRNHRGEAVTMVIRRRFSGELVSADRDPSVVLLEEGVYSVNRRSELIWTIEIPAGDEIALSYDYRVLVSH
jgi:hypothetical protein